MVAIPVLEVAVVDLGDVVAVATHAGNQAAELHAQLSVTGVLYTKKRHINNDKKSRFFFGFSDQPKRLLRNHLRRFQSG